MRPSTFRRDPPRGWGPGPDRAGPPGGDPRRGDGAPLRQGRGRQRRQGASNSLVFIIIIINIFYIKLKGVSGGSFSGGRLLRLTATPHSLLLSARRGGERICRKPRIMAPQNCWRRLHSTRHFRSFGKWINFFLAVSFRSGSHIFKKNLCMGFVSFFSRNCQSFHAIIHQRPVRG